ncbi:hypothetical protein [Xanthomonas oryzae]|uniref:hypothetical protein n=1 Tax=Xanthomonas oryzae TaxID=347 RepID=UPI0002D8758E|nr:hypothetical protein [Xanthomonas oryzae]
MVVDALPGHLLVCADELPVSVTQQRTQASLDLPITRPSADWRQGEVVAQLP